LLALPGECNFSGTKVRPDEVSTLLSVISESWLMTNKATCVKKLKASTAFTSFGPNPTEKENETWMWLLDASKLAATSDINISRDYSAEHRPHFCCVSFYKMFGYPTGIGALIVRKSVQHLLHKK
jgi:hypothetical protein